MIRRLGLVVGGALCALLLLAACGGGTASEQLTQTEPPTSAPESGSSAGVEEAAVDNPQSTAAVVAPTAVPTPITLVRFEDDFGSSIAPILTNNCASCHNSGGPGATHWRLETADDAVATSQLVSRVVSTGYMPPWPASDEGLVFANHRGIRDDERDAIIAWAAAGGEIDVAGDTALVSPTGPPALSNPTGTIAPAEAYAGSTAQRDDYRCQIYDPELTQDGWITGYNFVPDQTEVVHHAVGYLVPASAMAPALRRDAMDQGPGWECFGSSGLGPVSDELFLGWAPGQQPTEFPTGAALRIEAGDFFVIQIHYHYETEAPADASWFEVAIAHEGTFDEIVISDYYAPAEIPCSADEDGLLCDRDAAIANAVGKYGGEGVLADEVLGICGNDVADFADMTAGLAEARCTLPVFEFGELVSIFGHEHEIGTSFQMTLNPGRDDERLLLDIPKWDFEWQYNYEPDESIVLKPGDQIEIACAWDRSLRDPSLEPAYVVWADGTDDEMCFATIATRISRQN